MVGENSSNSLVHRQADKLGKHETWTSSIQEYERDQAASACNFLANGLSESGINIPTFGFHNLERIRPKDLASSDLLSTSSPNTQKSKKAPEKATFQSVEPPRRQVLVGRGPRCRKTSETGPPNVTSRSTSRTSEAESIWKSLETVFSFWKLLFLSHHASLVSCFWKPHLDQIVLWWDFSWILRQKMSVWFLSKSPTWQADKLPKG